MAHVGKEKVEREVLSAAFPCCGRPLPTHTGSLKSKIRRPGKLYQGDRGRKEGEREKQRQTQTADVITDWGVRAGWWLGAGDSQHCSSDL